MNDPEPDPHDDPWMTIAEFAEEMRVRPVTVRSWIAKGQLKATRAGQRKWLVRRSELTRMLEQGDGAIALPPPPALRRAEILEPDDRPTELWDQLAEEAMEAERERQDQDYALADYEWEIALEQSRMAPPDARFPNRIRHIAQAASRRAAAIRECMGGPELRVEAGPGLDGHDALVRAPSRRRSAGSEGRMGSRRRRRRPPRNCVGR